MIGEGNEPYDGARLSSIVPQSLQARDGILTANERSSLEYAVTYAPIHPDSQNLFSTHNQSMASLPPPIDRDVIDPDGDRYLDEKPQAGDTTVKRLTLERQIVFPPDGPSGDDVAQGDLGTCVLLSTLASIADHDPGQIRRMVKPSSELIASNRLPGSQLIPTVRGELPARLGRRPEARGEPEPAARLCANQRERSVLLRKEAGMGGAVM
ncbi:hypothetical protein [Nonomuraea sp. NPDC050786]|uniref:hypothetical protein n=1 Tax=Nonomuraea sp. NPDC050786 TaxID=3154840 RepID=UPI0033C68E52